VNLETIKIVGKENIIEKFYRPYTKKMWGLELEQLDPEIINRVPIRDDDNEYYLKGNSGHPNLKGCDIWTDILKDYIEKTFGKTE
jgi:UDP-galactopyranose mutase